MEIDDAAVVLPVDAGGEYLDAVGELVESTAVYIQSGRSSLRSRRCGFTDNGCRIDVRGNGIGERIQCGFLVGGRDMRLFGCSYYNNRRMTKLDGVTVVATATTNSSALVQGGYFPNCAPHMTMQDGPGRVVWRDCLYPGWKAGVHPGDAMRPACP